MSYKYSVSLRPADNVVYKNERYHFKELTRVYHAHIESDTGTILEVDPEKLQWSCRVTYKGTSYRVENVEQNRVTIKPDRGRSIEVPFQNIRIPACDVNYNGKSYRLKEIVPTEYASIQSVAPPKRTLQVDPKDLIYFSSDKQFIPVQRTRGPAHRSRRSLQKPSKVVSEVVNLQDAQYHARKVRPNEQLFEDVGTYLGKTWLAGIRVFALDDFNQTKERLNTYDHFVKYGGLHKDYYLCNPDRHVARKIYDSGGKSIPFRVGECMRDPDISIPKPFHAIYLDYTSKWKTVKGDLVLLFQNHGRFFHKKGVVLHLTLSKIYDRKEEYGSIMDDIIRELRDMGAEYGYEIIPIRKYWSSKMYKIGISIKPKPIDSTQHESTGAQIDDKEEHLVRQDIVDNSEGMVSSNAKERNHNQSTLQNDINTNPPFVEKDPRIFPCRHLVDEFSLGI